MSTYSIWQPCRLFKSSICRCSSPRFHTMTCEIVPDVFWTFSIYTIEVLHTQKQNSPIHNKFVLGGLWRTRKPDRWFLEICLTQLHSRTADSCSWTSQDSELGGRIVESLEAISCQDRRLLQIRWGQIQEMIYPPLTVVGIISQVMTDGLLFFFFPAYSPASKTKADRFIYQLIRQTDRQMERLTPVSVIMGTWDKDRLQWKETSSCLSLSLLIFFFSEDIDEQTPCSKKTQWPHGTSQTTAAGKPKI